MALIDIRIYKPATFNGRHNHIKARSFYALYVAKRYLTSLTARGLSDMAGTSVSSMRVLLSRWLSWEYVTRKRRPGYHEYYYTLSAHGKEWLSNHYGYVKDDFPVVAEKLRGIGLHVQILPVRIAMESDGWMPVNPVFEQFRAIDDENEYPDIY